MKRFPVTLIGALLAVALTATAVFAARTPHVLGPSVAPAATIIPDEPAPTATSAQVTTETDRPETADPSESEKAEPSEADEDAAGAKPDSSAHPSNHGQVVSAAAQASTPAGCKNHGEYVSLVARGVIDPAASPSPSQSVCDVASPTDGAKDADDPGKSGNANGGNGAQNGSSNNGKGKGPAPRPTRS